MGWKSKSKAKMNMKRRKKESDDARERKKMATPICNGVAGVPKSKLIVFLDCTFHFAETLPISVLPLHFGSPTCQVTILSNNGIHAQSVVLQLKKKDFVLKRSLEQKNLIKCNEDT